MSKLPSQPRQPIAVTNRRGRPDRVLSVERREGKNLIVLRAPGGQNRPYKAPRAVTAKTKEYHYDIRRFSSTVEVKPNSEDEQSFYD